MNQDSSDTITTSAKRFFSGTLISRAAGLVREIAMAAAFGTTPAVAAFWMAFRFAYLLRRFFGEGALNISFIPHFEALRKEDPEKGARFFYDLSLSLTLILCALILLVEGILGGCLLFKESEVIRLTMLMLPGALFISLYALNSSLLNCQYTYFLPSVAPAIVNVIWIISIFVFWTVVPQRALEYMAVCIVCAFAMQWAFTLPPVIRYLSEYRFNRTRFFGREIVVIMRPFFLAMVGVAATQINSALDAIFARFADSEGPAFLWYAIRIQQLPLALFGLGLTGALLPPISRAFKRGDVKQYRTFIHFGLKKVLIFMLPLSVGIFVLGFSSINLVYGHGAFTEKGTLETAQCLWAYGCGLVPMTLILVLAAAFYAQKNYRIPTTLSVITVALNISLNALFVLVLQMGAVSVAIATTLTAYVNGALLAIFLYRQGDLELKGIGPTFFKMLMISISAASLTLFLGHVLFQEQTWAFIRGQPLPLFSRDIFHQLLIFSTQALCYGGLFWVIFLLFPLKKERAPTLYRFMHVFRMIGIR